MTPVMLGLLLNILLPGTQPGELTVDLRPPSVCAPCHGGHGAEAALESWQGTMMGNAARDPIFQAALTVARQDEPDAPDLCIRCHSPRAWLFGRSEPGDLADLEAEDFESVQCDFCHRLVPGPDGERRIGTGQYTVADDVVRRGPLEETIAPHETELSRYHEESALCGLCHDVSNPLRDGFAIERTYSEWAASAYPAEGATCQSCHMPARDGHACGAREAPVREVHVHELAGGNAWIPLVLAAEHPELGRQASYERTAQAAVAQLESAAQLSVVTEEPWRAGRTASFVVRVDNLTGHKLPTGYPEGRRMWLEVQVLGADGRALLSSGVYDEDEASLPPDPQLRAYQVRMAAEGVEGFHFILQDELLEDSRIPPRGFVPAPDTTPVGRDYPVLPDGTLASWDDAPYVLALPADAPEEVVVRATLFYQTISREYVEALRASNRSDETGERLFALWQRHGKAPPVRMASVESTVAVQPVTLSPVGGGCATSPGRGAGDLLTTLSLLFLALWSRGLMAPQRR